MKKYNITYKTIFSRYFILILLTFIISSCEDIISVNLHSVEPQLVIEGVIRMDEFAQVRISQTQDFSDNNKYPLITNATVNIRDHNNHSEELIPNSDGVFIAQTIVGIEKTTYYLTVIYDDVEYTATTFMPPRVAIDSLTLWKFPLVDFKEPMVHFQDPPGEENRYYRFIVAINGEYPRLIENLVSTEFMDGQIIRAPIIIRYEGGKNKEPIRNGDLLTIEMRCLDKETYTFFDTLNDIEEALANPINNITGGALGYFGAYSYTSKSIISEW